MDVQTPDASPNPAYHSRRTSSTFEGSARAESSPATSPSTSPVALPQSEHDRLVSAVQRIEPNQFGEVVQLLEGVSATGVDISLIVSLTTASRPPQLPKKARAMCLFNPEYLKQKVADALLVLSSSDDETPAPPPAPATPDPSESAPEASPSPVTATDAVLPTSLVELGALPAATIIALEAQLGSLGVAEVDEDKKAEMDLFMDGLAGKAPHEVKQKLGE